MKIKMVVSCLLVFLALSGCLATTSIEPMIDLNNPEEISNKISVERDDFKKVTIFTGPDFDTEKENHRNQSFVRAWVFDNEQPVQYQIYVVSVYFVNKGAGGFRNYNNTYDSNGNKLETMPISKQLGPLQCLPSYVACQYSEHFGVNISEKYMKDNQENGIHFKTSGTSGEIIQFVPPAYIKAMLSAVYDADK